MFDFPDAELAADVGQQFIIGFAGASPSAPSSVQSALNEGAVGGVILFRRNIDTIDQLVALNKDLHTATNSETVPPFVAIDQEGGRVVRIGDPLTPLPTMRRLAQAADLRDIARVSEMLASELCALGINLNFAPVLDVDTNPDNPVIGDRSFCSDPEKVARCGAGFLLGHHSAGVIPCAKHFPGHGDTISDSHQELPRLMHDKQRLEEVELYPFQRAVAADIPMIMTAHVELPALDTSHPATLSTPILNGLLRKKLQFQGVIITDCLEMKAVADRYEITEMIDLGLQAGVDIFLICHTEKKWCTAIEHLYRRASNDDDIRQRVAASARRVRTLKTELLGHWPRPWQPRDGFRDLLGNPSHRALVEPYLDDATTSADDPTAPPASDA